MPKLLNIIFTVVGVAFYGFSSWATYSDQIRLSRYYWVIGLAAAVGANVLWLLLAKNVGEPKKIFLYGLLWDIGFVAISVLIPYLCSQQRFTPVGYLGLAMIVVGGIVLKEFGFG